MRLIHDKECRIFIQSSNITWYLLWAGYCARFQELTSNQNPNIPASCNSESGGRHQ